MLAVGVLLVKILLATEQGDEISSLGGDESSLGLPEAPTLPDAPTLPSADTTANSMYGGTQDLYAQPVMATPPPPSEDPPTPVVDSTPAEGFDSFINEIANDAPSGPPLPASGLPEGWTMEQWAHYGQRWIDQNK